MQFLFLVYIQIDLDYDNGRLEVLVETWVIWIIHSWSNWQGAERAALLFSAMVELCYK